MSSPAPSVFAALLLVLAGAWAAASAPIDALPDLSEVQVIVAIDYAGQAPRIVEDQVTYPLATALRAVPGASAVRGYSFFGQSFVAVVFADGTDRYWARTRVLETLNPALTRLPADAHATLGPDATSVGWVFEYALVDRTGRHDLMQLRSLQDWFLRPELQSLHGVAEVATVGGMVKEYQVVVDPLRLRAFGVSTLQVREAIEKGNGETGGSAIELAETEYMLRTRGYVRSVEDIRKIPIRTGKDGVPVTVGDIADVQLGPQMRRGIAELDGQGEVAGGIVVMRDGANAVTTIRAVRERLAQLAGSLPPGVQVVATYDRSSLIERAIDNLTGKVIIEMLVVLAVFGLFLTHLRSALVVCAVLVCGVLGAFVLMRMQLVTANIMSLGGIAIAVGAMVDAAIVMLENAHKKLEGASGDEVERRELISRACAELGPTLVASLLVIAAAFLPVLALGSQEGKLFAPLAYTKTYSMLVAAVLSVTLAPALMRLWVRGRIRRESEQSVSRFCMAVYRPALASCLRRPWLAPAFAAVLVLATVWPASRLGWEFMPTLDEGDWLYMPTAAPGMAPDAARQVLQLLDRSLYAVPEVQHVFGKAGRADTATDPAPIDMFEILVQLKPQAQWRPNLSPAALRHELESAASLPGLAGSWLPPIRSRIEMLSTAVRAPLGLEITGPDLSTLGTLGERIARILRTTPGAGTVFAEQPAAGNYLEIEIDRAAAARVGLNVADVNEFVATAIGGRPIGESVEGRERYPIILRYPREQRDSLERLRSLVLVTPQGVQTRLGDIARLKFAAGPALIRSDDARETGWISVDVEGRDIGTFVTDAQARVAAAHVIPTGYAVRWTGQFEHLQRARARLAMIVPVTLAIILMLLYLTFRRWTDVLLVLGALPLALTGGVWLMWAMHMPMSVASAVGFIALGGVAVETGVVMLLYLNLSWRERSVGTARRSRRDLVEAIEAGALLRLRPKLMTVATITAGLLPMLFGRGAGTDVMRSMAVPMIGGMLSAAVLTLLVIPALYLLVHGSTLESSGAAVAFDSHQPG